MNRNTWDGIEYLVISLGLMGGCICYPTLLDSGWLILFFGYQCWCIARPFIYPSRYDERYDADEHK